jgi:hypothetical protein
MGRRTHATPLFLGKFPFSQAKGFVEQSRAPSTPPAPLATAPDTAAAPTGIVPAPSDTEPTRLAPHPRASTSYPRPRQPPLHA